MEQERSLPLTPPRLVDRNLQLDEEIRRADDQFKEVLGVLQRGNLLLAQEYIRNTQAALWSDNDTENGTDDDEDDISEDVNVNEMGVPRDDTRRKSQTSTIWNGSGLSRNMTSHLLECLRQELQGHDVAEEEDGLQDRIEEFRTKHCDTS